MNFRQTEIANTLTEWLDRYSCPTSLRDKPKAAQAEAEALAGVLFRHAPRDEYRPFLNRVFSQLDYQMKTRAWPTVGEVGAVCVSILKDDARGGKAARIGDETDMRPCAIAARAMAEGKPVGEGWLYGRQAVELIAARLIDRETMTRYRSAAFLSRKAAYGEAAALAWEAEAKQRHEDARQIHRQTSEAGREVEINANRIEASAA